MIFNGKKLKELRKIKNISVEELADMLGVTKTAIYGWQGKNAMPDANNLSELAAIFNVEKSELLADETKTIPLEFTPWKDAAYQQLKAENTKLWQLVQKLTGAQVADLGKLMGSRIATNGSKIVPFAVTPAA